MQLGIVGLGTMGANLARNAARNGATVAVFNRTKEKIDAFISAHGKEGSFIPCATYADCAHALKPPRPILLMVKAGPDVDMVIDELIPHLSKGDILIDAGNSHYIDTERRESSLKEKGIRFLGMGVSGGEGGALSGPSMMPGGHREAVEGLMPLLTRMAAQDGDGGACVSFVGSGGAGHFVKMVHNGIEYALMQLIAESYDLLKSGAGKTNDELAEIFGAWNDGEDLQSYLMEITAAILKKKDGSRFLIDIIRDAAGQKGTGRWTTEAALLFGVPIPTINAAVDARVLSGDRALREKGKSILKQVTKGRGHMTNLVTDVRSALELSMIAAYQQGFLLMEKASEVKGWKLDLGEIARIWRGGCIIRSAYLAKVQQTYTQQRVHPYELERFGSGRQLEWRNVVAYGAEQGIPLPTMGASLNFFDAVLREHLPQNLIQAQRDYFGAHGFERTDKEGVHHGEWR